MGDFMKKWENKSILITGKANDLEEVDKTLDEAGEEGWELIAVIPLHVSWSSFGSSGFSFMTFFPLQ